MEKVGSILLKSLDNMKIGKKILEAGVFLYYETIVGEKIAAVSRPTSIKNQVLFIVVDSPVWSQRLHFFKNDIMEKINNYFGRKIVSDIKFHIYPAKLKKENHITKISDNKIIVPDKKVKLVYNISSEIKDEKLREKFKELMMKDIIYKMNKGEDKCSSI